ncbi:acyltransferase family protein [Paenibacillus silviterrae]|uniref:acyltransferase family protein n=1 Tax=Paenibacillus silviterrae TaxID=3242194 RepID=UPI002543092F|nr:acyltransferase family protein [Paenibacillus chinjuensis]
MQQPIIKQRLVYLDHLKIALMMLVVAHHAGQPYGSSNGFWFFKTQETTELGSFFAVNAGFFMSLFFLLSAYFLPASFDRKGAGHFLRDRLGRFGIPLLLGFLGMIPLLMYTYYTSFRGYPPISFPDYYIHVYLGLGSKPADWTGPSWPDFNFGHLWFIEHLLFYSLVYALLRRLVPVRPITGSKAAFPKSSTIIAYALGIGTVTFLVRIEYPIDRWVGFLGIIQTEFAHVPQYVSFFIAGALAARRQWLDKLPAKQGILWLAVGVTLAGIQYAGLLRIHSFGGLAWGSFYYSLHETFMCTGLCIGLITLFRHYGHRPFPVLKAMAAGTYAGYIIHVPIVVALQFLAEEWPISPFQRFVWVTLLGILGSFLISHFILLRLPLARRIL